MKYNIGYVFVGLSFSVVVLSIRWLDASLQPAPLVKLSFLGIMVACGLIVPGLIVVVTRYVTQYLSITIHDIDQSSAKEEKEIDEQKRNRE